jgi:hypothetical protein
MHGFRFESEHLDIHTWNQKKHRLPRGTRLEHLLCDELLKRLQDENRHVFIVARFGVRV